MPNEYLFVFDIIACKTTVNPASFTYARIPPKRCNEERVTCVPSIIIIITGTAPNNIRDNCTVVFLRHVENKL